MTKKINDSKTYRPNITDEDHGVRDEVEQICNDYPILNKKGLEKMIFQAGIPVVKRNLAAVKISKVVQSQK